MSKEHQSLTKKTMSGTMWVFGERILTQFIAFIVSVFLARLLFPSEYGVIALCSAFIGIAKVFVEAGLSTALVQKKNPEKIDYSTVFVSSLIISLVLYVVLFFVARPIALFFGAKYNTETIVYLIRIIALSMPLGAYKSTQLAYVQKKFLFKKLFWGSFLGTLFSGVFGILAAYHGLGAYSLAIQSLSDIVIDIIIITIAIKWFPGFKFSFKSFRALFGYGSKIFATTLIDRCYNSLTDFVIGKEYSSANLAFYNKGKQLPHLIGDNVEGAINSALFPAMSHIQDDKKKIKEATRRSIQMSSYIIFPMLIGLMCVCEPLIKVLYTDKWLECIPYLILTCASYLTITIKSPILQAIKATGRSDVYLILDIFKKVTGIAALFISFKFGVFWIAFALVLSSFVGLIINIIPCKKLLNYNLFEMVSDIYSSLLISIIMGVTVLSISRFITNDIILLLTRIIIGIITYILFSLFTQNKSFIFIKNTIQFSIRKHLKKKLPLPGEKK